MVLRETAPFPLQETLHTVKTGELIIWQAQPTHPSPTVDSILAQEPSMLTTEEEKVLFSTIRTGQHAFSRLIGLTRFNPFQNDKANDTSPLENEMRKLSKQTLFKNSPFEAQPFNPNDTQESLFSTISQGIRAFHHLALSYYPFAQAIAAKLLTPEYRQFFILDDFIHLAFEGLMHSAAVFDETLGAKFATFAAARMKGAILDEVRKLFPRTITQHLRRIHEAETQIAAKEALSGSQNGYSNSPQTTEQKIAAETELSIEQIRNAQSPSFLPPVSLDFRVITDESEKMEPHDPADSDPHGMPETSAVEKETMLRIHGAVAELSPREQILFSLHFANGEPQREIAPTLGVSEARVSQIYTQALRKVKIALGSDPRLPPKIP